MKFFFIVVLQLISLVTWAQGVKFDFTDSFQQWGQWGEGIAVHDPSMGHQGKGSIRLSTDWGETHTIHYDSGKISPGTYKISFYVRSSGVLADEKNFSFWHFLDKGAGTENIFTNLHGSYEWRKVEYTVDIKDKLLLWFRLKSSGKVWIDDFSLKKVDQSEKITIASPIPLKRTYEPSKSVAKKAVEKIILDFDKLIPTHPFSTKLITSNKVGVVRAHQFYNLNPSHFLKGDWQDYDYLNLEVFNPNDQYVPFSLTLGDSRSSDYWSQLNHKSSLAPGWNKLSFSLNQFLGERGSHRHQRGLNLSAIKKWFIIIDPDKTLPSLNDFAVDNFSLETIPVLSPPAGVWAYDFTSQKNNTKSNVTKVLTQDLYNLSTGYGFIDPAFWRVEDSVFAPRDLRYTIGIKKGVFRTKLPNGKYTLFLNFERLGYWDVSFWKNREIYLNGKIVLKETRSSVGDLLDDYLIFSNVIPEHQDHPYNLYLKNIFSYRRFEVEVKQGYLDIGLEGDPTGISLNHLLISKSDRVEAALTFIKQLDDLRIKEFDRQSRKTSPKSSQVVEGVKLIDLKSNLREDESYQESNKSIDWTGVKGESLYQLLELRGEGKVSINLTGVDEAFFRKSLKLLEGVPQIISPDLNHETYFFGIKYFRPMTKLSVKKDQAKFVLLELTVDPSAPVKKYESKIIVSVGDKTREVPLGLSVLPYNLPPINFPVGFFGPDPLPFHYVDSPELDLKKQSYRLEAITQLAQAGFTTFTGLPSAYKDGQLDLFPLTKIINHANASGMGGVYFSYGGEFPGDLLSEKEETFYSIIQKLNAQLVYTFSDEPGGYSDRVSLDLKLAKDLKNKFPILLRGGFTNLNDKALGKLNSFFDYPFYSHVHSIPKVKGWGSYNAAAGAMDDPRFVLSAGLYRARKSGLTHYLEWHSSAIHNYPYYGLDGRESDIELFMASKDGRLYPTVKFILGREGIQNFRKLTLLENLLQTKTNNDAQIWLRKINVGHYSDSAQLLKANKEFNFNNFLKEMNSYLNSLNNN